MNYLFTSEQAIDQDGDVPNGDFTIIVHICTRVTSALQQLVTYAPRELGTHTAKLRVYCANAGVPLVSIPLKGEATAVLGDMDDNGLLTIGDVTGIVDQLLKGTCDTRADMNNDGKVSIGDVTVLINCLLGGE